MWTALFVIVSVVVVAIQLAVATVHFDGSRASDKADRIEEQLDRELHDWVIRSLDLEQPDGPRAAVEVDPNRGPG